MSAITRAWRSLFFCLLVLVFAASPAPTRAQQNPFVGSWSGVFGGVSAELRSATQFQL